jgi:hypothetical protein
MWTDMTAIIVAGRNFAKDPKKQEPERYVVCANECSSPAGRHSPDRFIRHQRTTNAMRGLQYLRKCFLQYNKEMNCNRDQLDWSTNIKELTIISL